MAQHHDAHGSRPVDVILSIMGLFGVTLDASAFRSTDQRGAAIALAQAILRKGGRASWLGAVFHLPPDKRLSAFPAFPQPSASGAGRVPVTMEYPGWWLDGVPGGSMDDAGYFTFTSKAAPLVPAGASPSAAPHDGGRVVNARRSGRGATVAAIDGSMWEIQDSRVAGNGGRKHGGAFIVFLGRLEQDFRGARARMLDTLRAILVQAHAPERFHRISYFVLYDKWQPVIDTWEERRFSVGGGLMNRRII
ncbi:hypothetical protein A0H81_06668 [Grifola frondosa]|uniref:Uncharacterized protein n=1 Tax=Grifola frondosa TaxID=5627 RepID=A0A1C7MEN5_GRIFR|nr:hypothetical protein A0H81_06668 [Grifola frondosa]